MNNYNMEPFEINNEPLSNTNSKDSLVTLDSDDRSQELFKSESDDEMDFSKEKRHPFETCADKRLKSDDQQTGDVIQLKLFEDQKTGTPNPVTAPPPLDTSNVTPTEKFQTLHSVDKTRLKIETEMMPLSEKLKKLPASDQQIVKKEQKTTPQTPPRTHIPIHKDSTIPSPNTEYDEIKTPTSFLVESDASVKIGSAGTLFKNCRIAVVEGGKDMGKRRAKVVSNLVAKHGAEVVINISRATHVVTGFSSVEMLKSLGQGKPNRAVVVSPNWVTASVKSKQLSDLRHFKVPGSSDGYQLSTRTPTPSPTVQNKAILVSKADADKKKFNTGFIPVFFENATTAKASCDKTETPRYHVPNTRNERQIKYLEEVKPFACQRGKQQPEEGEDSPPTNERLIAELQKLQDTYTNIGDHWRKYAYGKAVAIIKKWNGVIRSANDLRGVHGIGDKTMAKIQEILNTGSCAKMRFLEKCEDVQVISTFGKIWGVGPSTAQKLYSNGVRSIEELHQRKDELLNDQQKIGLKYFDELQERIPRIEVDGIKSIVTTIVREYSSEMDIEVCGSYRRGKQTCGDVDILMCERKDGNKHDGILELVARKLVSTGFIKDDLSKSLKSGKNGEPDSYFGVCQIPMCDDNSICPFSHLSDIGADNIPEGDLPPVELRCRTHIHRRLDIKIYSPEHYPFAILYFTGSNYFNRSMRLYCQKKGLSLSDRWLVPVVRVAKEKVHEGTPIPCHTENDIFKAIGLDYKTPLERDL